MRVAVYPGSFDPFTRGHLDILGRAAKLFDHIIVAVLAHPSKNCLFPPTKRVELISEVVRDLENVRAIHFNGLLVDFCRMVGACAVIRGLRAVSDYEYELQMFAINKSLEPELESVFLMASMQYSFLSSSIVKEVARYGGNVSNLVPPEIEAELKRVLQVEKEKPSAG